MSDDTPRPLAREQISQLLEAWAGQDSAARDQLVPIVYDELRRIAHHYMRTERTGHTLQTTALVNEAYLRLVDVERMQWRDRAHFFAIAATMMRRILVDHARAHVRDKRGGGAVLTTLDEDVVAPARGVDVIALDEALERLGQIDERQSRLVELRYFAGLTIEEAAEALGISGGTVKREWAIAKAWLFRELHDR
jgi:RNA polymerase sigma factor (TIGR02999 family)